MRHPPLRPATPSATAIERDRGVVPGRTGVPDPDPSPRTSADVPASADDVARPPGSGPAHGSVDRGAPGSGRRGALAVVMVEDRLGEDGAARSNVRLVDRWARSDARPRLFAVQRVRPGAPGVPLPAGVRPVYPTRGRLRLRRAVPWAVVRLAVLARRSDVVVSGREIGWGLLVGRAAALLARRPFVAMVRSEPAAAMDQYVGARLRPLTRLALRTADRLVCITPGLVPAVEDLGVHPGRISVVLNGIEVPRVLAAARAAPPALAAGDGPLVVAIGRLDPQKGFDVLLRAHARVLHAGVRHRLLILGEGAQRGELTALAETLGVTGTVTMPGFAPDPVPALAAADLYCLTSRWEGFGQTLAEALVVGTPVVSTDCVSGPRHLLGDGARGDLVPVDDVEALAAAIEGHLRDPRRLAAVAVRAREWAVASLDVERTAAQVLEVLREVAATRRLRAG